MTGVPIGAALQRLNCTLDIADGDLVETVLVIAKVVTADGIPTVVIADVDGLTWYDQLALHTAAGKVMDDQAWVSPEDEAGD